MTRITLTRKGFREWLEGKPGEEIVGLTCMTLRCPIAKHLGHLGWVNAHVSDVEYGAFTGGRKPLPNWAMRFINDIDVGVSLNPITARQALTVLDGKEPTA